MRCIEARGRYKELRSGGRGVDGGLSQIGSFTLFVEPNTHAQTHSFHSVHRLRFRISFFIFLDRFPSGKAKWTDTCLNEAEEERVVLAMPKVPETILSQ